MIISIPTHSVYIDSECHPADVRDIVKHCDNPEISRYLLRMPYPYTEQDAISFLGMIINANAQHPTPTQFLIRNAETHETIGAIAFLLRYGYDSHKDEFGYWLAQDYWGRGIVTACITALRDYCFYESPRRLLRLEARVFTPNLASARALEKAGFELEGVFRKNEYKPELGYLDGFMYAALADTERHPTK